MPPEPPTSSTRRSLSYGESCSQEHKQAGPDCRIARRASYTVRMSLSRRSVLSDLISYAHHSPALPDHQVLQTLYSRMVQASRAGDLRSLYEEVLTCARGERFIAVPVDMTNTQFSGAALYDPPFAAGYEPEILALLQLFLTKDGVLYDIGSNWGYFTFHALLDPAFCGRVVAMEPVARSLADLENVAAALDVADRVIALQLAAGEAESMMPISDDAASGNQSLVGARASGEMVKVVAIDDLDVPPPDLLKLDVENFELFALRGMRATIAKTRAPIIFENWHDPANSDESVKPLKFLSELGYHLYVPEFTAANEPRGDIPFQMTGELSFADLTPSTRADHPPRINILASATRLI
jgi:FkbM family methyltransferase